jgi:7-cyano-7-deazaguanine synthase
MEQAEKICNLLQVPRTSIDLGYLFHGATSSMLADGTPPPDGLGEGVAPTFLPGRNGLFIQVAAIFASRNCPSDLTETNSIIAGVNQVDFSGYPDCRADFIRAMDMAIRLGFEKPVQLICPLLYMSKDDIVRFAYHQLPTIDALYGYRTVDKVLALTHTCYNGQRPACGRCAACILRKEGFEKAGYKDPAYNEAQ